MMRTFVYITSASYSGSTLLTFMLNTHPSITTVGELKGDSMDVEAYHCSCGQPIGRCGHWSRVIDAIRARGLAFDLTDKWTQCGFRVRGSSLANRVMEHRMRAEPLELARGLFLSVWPGCRAAFERAIAMNEAFVDAECDVSGKPVFLDASKTPIRLKYLRRVPSFRIKVIAMDRDGRGVTNSIMKYQEVSAERAAAEWVSVQVEIDRVLRLFDRDSVFRLRYEDLCRDPVRMLRRIHAFIGCEEVGELVDFRSVEHHILGNRMRLGGSSEIVLDEKWRRQMSPESLAAFARVGGPLNRRLGYERDEADAAVEGTRVMG